MANGQGARKELYEQLDKVILQWKDEPGGLLPIMQNAQEILGCVDEEVQHYISEKVGVPVSTIYGVATFYSQFTLQPKGKYAIGLCLGTACYVRGSQLVMDELVTVSYTHLQPACKKQLKSGVCADRQCLGFDHCKNLEVDHRDYICLLYTSCA